MNEMILDTNAPQGEALKAVNINLNIDFNNKALMFSGNQCVPYQGKDLMMPLDFNNNVRISELKDATALQPDGDVKTKNEAKLNLANNAFDAIEEAITNYLQAVYLLNNTGE